MPLRRCGPDRGFHVRSEGIAQEAVEIRAVMDTVGNPVTRRVNPGAPVTAGSLTRYAARVLTVRGAPCAHGFSEPSRILNACSVTDPSITLPPEATISGRAAESVVDEIDRVLSK